MSKTRIRLLAGTFVILWSAAYIFSKVLITHVAPFTGCVLRFGGASVLFGLILIIRRPSQPALSAIGHSAVVGLLMLALQFGGVYGGLALGASSGFAALVIGSTPLATTVLAAILGQKQRANQWWGLLLGMCGVLLVLGDRLSSGIGSIQAGGSLFVGLCGITCGTLYQKRFLNELDLSIGLFVQNLAATLALAPFAIVIEGMHLNFNLASIGALLWLILINSGFTFAILYTLLRQGAATSVSTLFFLVPPITAVMGWIFLNETMTLIKILGFAVSAAGVYLGTRVFQSNIAPR
jgi:drug/metabolite transporter (DMT)-like permease